MDGRWPPFRPFIGSPKPSLSIHPKHSIRSLVSRLFYDTLVGLGKQGRPPGRCGLVGTIHKAERADGPPPLPWPLCASSHIPWNERSPHLGSRLPSRNSPIRNRRRLCPTVRRRLSGWKGWNYPIRKRPTDLKSAKPTGAHPLPHSTKPFPSF